MSSDRFSPYSYNISSSDRFAMVIGYHAMNLSRQAISIFLCFWPPYVECPYYLVICSDLQFPHHDNELAQAEAYFHCHEVRSFFPDFQYT